MKIIIPKKKKKKKKKKMIIMKFRIIKIFWKRYKFRKCIKKEKMKYTNYKIYMENNVMKIVEKKIFQKALNYFLLNEFFYF